MSWQPYVDDSLIGKGFRHGCITSHEGQVWATSSGFAVESQEAVRLFSALEGDSVVSDELKAHGFSVGGTMFALSRIDTDDDEVRYIIGRCKQSGEASRGICVVRTHRTLLFALHDPLYARGYSFEHANAAVYALAELLVGMSF